MKRKFFTVSSLLLASLIFAVPAVHAQRQLTANVPFDFKLDNKAMAAGNYEVRSIGEQIDLVTNLDNDQSAFMTKAIRVQASSEPHARLVFHRYGNQYFLCQIWDGMSNTGVELAMSKHERELTLAGNQFSDGPEIVIVAMN